MPDHRKESFSAPIMAEPKDNSAGDVEQDLWRQFAEASTPKDFVQSWLALQCHLISDVMSALVLLGPPDHGPFTPAGWWPNTDVNVTHLTGAAERALKERRGLLIKNEDAHHPDKRRQKSIHIAYPIELSGNIHGVIVLEIDKLQGHEVQTAMRQLHWGSSWLEVMLRRSDALQVEETNERLRTVIDLVTTTLEHERFQAAAMAFVTKVATIVGCDSVSLGFEYRNQIRVKVLSHTAEFGKQMNLVRAIGSAMDEAIDQGAVIIYPPPSAAAPLATHAHQELARLHGTRAICTVPLRNNQTFCGGLTLERPGGKPFDQASVEFCEAVAALAGPILDARRREERWLITKAKESLAAHLKKVIGPGYFASKIITFFFFSLVIFLFFARGNYRITATITLEGTVQRTVTAPFNGYLLEAPARPGDIIKEGDLLCRLDDRDLKLERHKWSTQREQLLKQYHEAMAKHERSQTQITKAKIDQSDAQISLLDELLIRSRIVSPFHAVIMKGDLSQSLGAPVERGQVLFEVAPLESYRIIMEVDERDIGEMIVGLPGELSVPSMPDRAFPFNIEKITPVSTAREGRNFFRVEAMMEEKSTRLRPGMEGIGKVTVDRRRLIWIWTHELFDWLRFKVWSWWP